MTTQNAAAIEMTDVDFSVEKMLEIRAKAQQAVTRIASQVKVGMLEEDANKMVVDTLKEMGATKAFHKPYIRFGTNTTKTFGADSDPGIKLDADDIYFIDVGPIWGNYEGDAGDTFVTGNDPDMKRAAIDAKKICDAVINKWKTDKVTGVELYIYAETLAKDLGWVLNRDLGGHRLGTYSSEEHHNGPLSEINFHPSPYLWMVEIHIRHPEKQFGAFYEDLLI